VLTKCWGSFPDPLAGFKGPTSKGGMEGEGCGGEEMGWDRRENGREREEAEGLWDPDKSLK